MKNLKNCLQQLQQIVFLLCKFLIVSVIYLFICCMLPIFKRCFYAYNSLQQPTTASSLQHILKSYCADILIVIIVLCVVCSFPNFFKTINYYGYK